MKTLLIKLTMTIVGIMLISALLHHSVSAQTIISFDTSPDNTMVLRIENQGLGYKTHRYVFIFDSARITYEFSSDRDYAMCTMDLSGGKTTIETPIRTEKETPASIKSEIKFDPSSLEEPVEEDPIELEAWMLDPEKWID